jgi:hypothetical protein
VKLHKSGHNTKLGLHGYEFHVKHPSLKRIMKVHVYSFHHPDDEHGNHGVIGVGSKEKSQEGTSFSHIGHLGTRNVMHVLGRIKHHIPHLEKLSGDRVTGARKDSTEKHTEVSIKHVKPIPPE